MIHDVDFPELKRLDESNLANYYKEQIVQLFYLLSRKENDYEIDKIGGILEETLGSLKQNMNADFRKYLVVLYKMIAQTRDILYGKGERKLTYMMIYVWYKFYPTLTIYAVHQLVDLRVLPDGFNQLQIDEVISRYVSTSRTSFGCWKDIKYLCYFLMSRSQHHPLINVAIEIMNKQLLRDWTLFSLLNEEHDFRNILSFVSKWVPRENTKFEWLFEKMAIQWAELVTPYFFKNKFLTYAQNDALLKKCKTNYRIVCSTLNRALDTIEIKQCKREWNNIVPSNIPKHAMIRQKNALLNVNRYMEPRIKTAYFKDRRNCSNNIKEYYADLIQQPENTMYNSNFELGSFVKQYSVLNIIESDDLVVTQNRLYQIDLLNKSWESFIHKFHSLQNFIPFVDINSFSSNDNTLYSAIELACIIATKTSFDEGHIMFSNHVPIWKKFIKKNTFYDNVSDIFNSINNDTNYLHDNILCAIDLFVQSLRSTYTSNDDISNMVIVIITNKEYCDYDSFLLRFEKEYMPHIIYWNMSQYSFSHEIPVVKNVEKITYISGYNSLLLNHFRFMGFLGVIQFGSYDTVCNFMCNKRYDCMGDYIENIMAIIN
jgi:hypothetical protein